MRRYPVIVQHSLITVLVIGICRLVLRTIRACWRFATGAPLDGEPRTDAGAFTRGTEALVRGRVAPWWYLPRAARAGVRLAVLVGTPVVLWAWMVHRGVLVALVVIVPLTVAWRRHRRAIRTGRSRRFLRTYVRPLAAAAGPILGQPVDRPDKWLKVDPHVTNLTATLQSKMTPAELRAREFYGTHFEPVIRYVPERMQRARWYVEEKAPWVVSTQKAFTRPTDDHPSVAVEIKAGVWVSLETRAEVKRMVREKLGLSNLDEHWDSVGPQTIARWTVKAMPPEKVTLEDIASVVDVIAEHEFVLGLCAGGQKYVVSVDDDSPHIACSAGSGAGKSVLAMLFGVQVLRRGGKVIILDLKGSHRWARGLEGVTYCRKPAEMHKALIEVNAIAQARNDQAFNEEDGWDPGPRILVIFEEMNSTVAKLKAYWADVRDKEDPKTSPAVTAFRELMFMGRAAKTNMFGVAQMLTANTTGGPETRECFGVRALARYTRNSLKMLVPECAMRRASRVRGRWLVAVDGDVMDVQVAFLTTAEARTLAMAGQGAPPASPVSPVSPDSGSTPSEQPCPDPVSQDIPDSETEAPVDPLGELVTLREAVERGIIEGKQAAVKKQMQRSDDSPRVRGKRGNANLYRVGDLIEWSMVVK